MEARKEEREKALAEGREEGRAEGKAKLAKSFVSLVQNGKLTLSEAVESSGLTEEDFKKYLEP